VSIWLWGLTVMADTAVIDLIGRYGLCKQAFYNRMAAIGITPFRGVGKDTRSYLTEVQVAEMDALHRHVVAGGLIRDFRSALPPVWAAPSKTAAEFLHKAVSGSWTLTTLEIRHLLGVTPVPSSGKWHGAGFLFEVCGAEGGQSVWRVFTAQRSVAV
jgi:hypothetical protein